MREVCRDWKEKTVSLVADGANVMLEERNGVYAESSSVIPTI